MKVDPTSSAPTKGTTVGGLRWTILPSGETIAAKPVTNFNSTSQKFQQMNATIVRLDSQYDALPNQSDWVAAAAPLSSVPICGCSGETMTGKKLYRLTNYFREISGESDTSTPPTYTDPGLLTPFEAQHTLAPPGQPQYTLIGWNKIGGFGLVLQLGRGDSNPVIQGEMNSFHYWLVPWDSDAQHIIESLDEDRDYSCCAWSSDFQPTGVTGFFVRSS